MDIESKIDEHLNRCINSLKKTPDNQLLADVRKALNYRFSEGNKEEITNTYLKELEIPQIVLFDILANRFPLVLRAQEIVNDLFQYEAHGMKSICIIDLGIGRGIQIARILKHLNNVNTLTEVTLIGLDILKPALEFTSNTITNLKDELNYTLNFYPIHSQVESIDIESIKELVPSSCEKILVNASLTLHHVQQEEERLNLLRKLKSINPSIITLIEPNADCATDDFEQRVFNAFEHFSALYQLINSLDLEEVEKKGLKQFFATDLFDPIALSNSHRFEKYCKCETWINYAKNCGFKEVDMKNRSILQEHNKLNAELNLGYVNLKFEETDLLGIIAVC